MSKISDLIDDFTKDFNSFSELHDTFDEREKFLIGDMYDSVTSSKTTKTQIVDQTLLSGLIRRTNDVMARIPTGSVKVLSKEDKGKAIFINLILNNYIIPNANTQYDLYTKFWLTELLSLIYGKVDLLVDYIIKKDYSGPDFYIIPARNGIPEAGVVSVNDASRYWIRSYVTPDWLKSKKGLKNWENIDKILEKWGKNKKKGNDKTSDDDKTSYIERKYQSTLENSNQIELITKYEKDKWTTLSPSTEYICREIDNPHKNGELPIVSKLCYPLLDRYFGLSEYERLITIQKAVNSILNLGIDSQKMAIYPPLKLFLPDLVTKTIKYESAAKWVLKNNNINAITQMPVSPTTGNAFQQLHALTKTSLLSSLGVSDTTTPSGFEAGMGKTPQALRMQAAITMSHTGFDRKMLEQAAEKVFDKFIDLILTKQEKPIELSLFKEDLKSIQNFNPDLVELFDSGEGGRIVIKPTDIKNTKYKFFIDAGTTVQKDQMVENETLTSVLSLVLKLPGVAQMIQANQPITIGGVTLNFGEIFKKWLSTSGLEGWEKMVSDAKQNVIEQPNQISQPEQSVQPNIQTEVQSNTKPNGQPTNFENVITQGLAPEQVQLLNEIYGQTGAGGTG